MTKFGDVLREERGRQGISRRELAKRTGVGTDSLYKYERGSMVPGLRHATAIADALGLSLDVMAGRSAK